ncbi:putative secreted protein [Boeremia exigua]|uniref:uncharacterized protein n=1 Tax=Boeremia exigua TaxID=749465 RepID=UPI001E8D9DD6|nr:uncharacterized protein C7974DRAFT_374500 [Boeremia exigua]KAH6637873.1 putative secreted protein [Boeremia exigua]
MAKPKVLIIGCGAVGLSQGYVLSAGADITYLVRPGRTPAFAPPKQLYSYKDDALYTFSSYRVIESATEVSGETFEFVFDTLDGHTARSPGGVATLSSVGDLLNEPQNASSFVAYDALGLDIDAHYARTLRVAPERLTLAFSMLAHQPTPQISVPAAANKDLVAKADLLYSHIPPNVGLAVVNARPALTKRIEAVYAANGKLRIQRMPAWIISWAGLLAPLHLMAWNIDGFGTLARLRANSELWALMLRAQTEILRLPRFGWAGWLLSFVLGSWATMKMNEPIWKFAAPMDAAEFNAFHHGGKVATQDVVVLEDVLREGERVGRKMEALREVVRRVRAIHAA